MAAKARMSLFAQLGHRAFHLRCDGQILWPFLVIAVSAGIFCKVIVPSLFEDGLEAALQFGVIPTVLIAAPLTLFYFQHRFNPDNIVLQTPVLAALGSRTNNGFSRRFERSVCLGDLVTVFNGFVHRSRAKFVECERNFYEPASDQEAYRRFQRRSL